jgi:asparagine synthase (glutamine-hydrolysing)
MCGIVGIASRDRASQVTARDIDRMCSTIVHRGPDDQGAYVNGPVGLGMRRLSIIDLTTGQQPICNEDRTIWVVFNGEIYNYRQLREELRCAGHQLYTNGDTEVIPHLYEELGTAFVHKLRGMFAIALYDERQRRVLLARDRLGKKPLFYAVRKDCLLFASEMRAIFAVAPELAKVDHKTLMHFFCFGYIPDPLSVYSTIRKLPPGHILDYQDGKVTVSRYWDVPQFSEDECRSESDWLEQLEHELTESVRMRLISDVPLGALLSGGVDSSTVVALMARVNSAPVKTFSVAFDKQDFDERHHARLVARRFGTEHHELTMQPDFWGSLNKLTELLEEPFGDASLLPTYYICQLVREHVKVALSGDGGDELFAGYDRYLINFRREIFRFIPDWAGRFYRGVLFPRLTQRLRGRRFLYNISLPFRDRYLDSISRLPGNDRESRIFSREFLSLVEEAESPREVFEKYYDHAPSGNLLGKLQYLDIKTNLAADILTKVDRMSMAASIETRAPLLDHVVVELAARIPSRLKLKGCEGKYLLKKMAERVGVPTEVIYRPKRGFGVPLVHWFRNELKSGLHDILTEPRTLQRGYFNPASVRHMMDEHMRGTRDRSSDLWLLLMFELWHRNFLEPVRGGTLFTRAWSDSGSLLKKGSYVDQPYLPAVCISSK